jgi:hypothetical protein
MFHAVGPLFDGANHDREGLIMPIERLSAYIASVMEVWMPLLMNNTITPEEFKQKIIEAVEFKQKLSTVGKV